MKDALMRVVKSFSWIKRLYTKAGSAAIAILSIFTKVDTHLILFNSFGGKKYDDSPKKIYEAMLEDKRFADYDFVWAFHEPEKFDIPRGRKIKTDNLQYFATALKARCWVTNSGIERGLSFKQPHTLYINTWHGTPLKKMGSDVAYEKDIHKVKCGYDVQNAQSEYEARIFARAYNIPYENMLVCGLPRNDELTQNDQQTQIERRAKLGIDEDKKVVLYAPTFREYERDAKLNCVIKPPLDFKKWKKMLGDDYVILLRCHYEVAQMLGAEVDGEFVRDVSAYPNLNDLMLASDMLITDYSSIMFDYAILERPIFVYTYDYETYSEKRGMYFDVREELPGGSITEDELLELITYEDKTDILKQVKEFRGRYVTTYGNATKITVDRIHELLKAEP